MTPSPRSTGADLLVSHQLPAGSAHHRPADRDPLGVGHPRSARLPVGVRSADTGAGALCPAADCRAPAHGASAEPGRTRRDQPVVAAGLPAPRGARNGARRASAVRRAAFAGEGPGIVLPSAVGKQPDFPPQTVVTGFPFYDADPGAAGRCRAAGVPRRRRTADRLHARIICGVDRGGFLSRQYRGGPRARASRRAARRRERRR